MAGVYVWRAVVLKGFPEGGDPVGERSVADRDVDFIYWGRKFRSTCDRERRR